MPSVPFPLGVVLWWGGGHGWQWRSRISSTALVLFLIFAHEQFQIVPAFLKMSQYLRFFSSLSVNFVYWDVLFTWVCLSFVLCTSGWGDLAQIQSRSLPGAWQRAAAHQMSTSWNQEHNKNSRNKVTDGHSDWHSEQDARIYLRMLFRFAKAWLHTLITEITSNSVTFCLLQGYFKIATKLDVSFVVQFGIFVFIRNQTALEGHVLNYR